MNDTNLYFYVREMPALDYKSHPLPAFSEFIIRCTEKPKTYYIAESSIDECWSRHMGSRCVIKKSQLPEDFIYLKGSTDYDATVVQWHLANEQMDETLKEQYDEELLKALSFATLHNSINTIIERHDKELLQAIEQ